MRPLQVLAAILACVALRVPARAQVKTDLGAAAGSGVSASAGAASAVTAPPFVATLRGLGVPEESTSRLLSFLAGRHPGDPERVYHGQGHSFEAADFAARVLESADLPAGRKVLLIFAASLHDVDPERVPETPARVSGTLAHLDGDPEARALVSDFGGRFGFTADQVKALVMGTDFSMDPAEMKAKQEAFVLVARKAFPGEDFGVEWGRHLAFVDQAATYLQGAALARRRVESLAHEIRTSLQAVGKEGGPSDAQMLAGTAQFLSTLRRNHDFQLLPADLQSRFQDVQAYFAERQTPEAWSDAAAPTPARGPPETFVPGEDLSPTFHAPDSPARDEVAAEALPKDKARVARALQGVELPPVLAYKAASMALRDDLKGVFSEIGAAQKIAEEIYKIRGQKIIAASVSPYAREASDDRYSAPVENPASEDYTSVKRLRQQLSREYSGLAPVPGKLKFVVATTARTSWGNGHAWLGIRAQLAADQAPVTLMLHVRMLGRRTRNQKDVLGAIGVNALFGVYYHVDDLKELVLGLGDGLSINDFSIDYLSVAMPDGSERAGLEGNLELLRHGWTGQLLLAPGGVPVAPAQAGQEHKFARWSVLSNGKAIGSIVASAAIPPQEEPILVKVRSLQEYAAAGGKNSWTVITQHLDGVVEVLKDHLYPAPRSFPPAPSLAHSRTDAEAKELNSGAMIKGVFTDIGGYQSAATRFFEASNSRSIYSTFSYPDESSARSRYGPQGTSSDLEYLKKVLSFEFDRVKFPKDAPAQLRRFALATRAAEDENRLHGYVGLKLGGLPGRRAKDVVVAFDFHGGTWQDRRNALATLGVNLIFTVDHETPSDGFLKSLHLDMPKIDAMISVAE